MLDIVLRFFSGFLEGRDCFFAELNRAKEKRFFI